MGEKLRFSPTNPLIATRWGTRLPRVRQGWRGLSVALRPTRAKPASASKRRFSPTNPLIATGWDALGSPGVRQGWRGLSVALRPTRAKPASARFSPTNPHMLLGGTHSAPQEFVRVGAVSRLRCGRRGLSPHRRRNDWPTGRNWPDRGRRGRACSARRFSHSAGLGSLLAQRGPVPGLILAPWLPPRRSHPAARTGLAAPGLRPDAAGGRACSAPTDDRTQTVSSATAHVARVSSYSDGDHGRA